MIVLDTNVLSELMTSWQGESRVRGWLRSLGERPVTTTFNRAELLAGAARLPEGQRRRDLVSSIHDVMSDLGVTLPFSSDCAAVYAEVTSARVRDGRPIGVMDGLIASVALVNGASVATRDVDGFTGVGLTVVNPWDAEA